MTNFTTATATTILFLSSTFLSILALSLAGDAINPGKPLRDSGDDTIVSAGRVFEFGFFSPGSSNNRYVGIWYYDMSPQTVVWIANRETPIPDRSGILNLTEQGNLLLLHLNGTSRPIWSSNTTSAQIVTPVAQLLDTGNLVLRNAANQTASGNFLWQSFDYPCDTLLPGMRMGLSRRTGREMFMSSWTSANDPSPGAFSIRVDPDRYGTLAVHRNGALVAMSGPWNGVGFSATPGFRQNPYFAFEFVYNSTDAFYSYEPYDKSMKTRFVVNYTGEMNRLMWNQGWVVYLTNTADNCFRYNLCGSYGRCNPNSLPMCGCLKKFVPKSPREWEASNWRSGCTRDVDLDCLSDGFVKYSGIKPPDTLHYWQDGRLGLEECRRRCLRNCSCMAYMNSDIRGAGSGCLMWFEELLDIRESVDDGRDVYIRMAASQLDQAESSSRRKRVRIIASIVSVIGMLLLSLILILYIRKKQPQKEDELTTQSIGREHKTDDENLELPTFDLTTIAYATDNFSLQQKIGEGGFGPVYKGVLEDGQEIAVKRLSKSSNQGLNEFKNEVSNIAKLQHRNLVKLLGCCIQLDEKMLVYEYMPNKSLDFHIFDQTKSRTLDWPKRFDIINGIARGLLYLHQDSRLRIIHRDLKASNVLLDKDLNPKISDFGMARSVGGNETEGNTKRVVGTFGYMSPEYAIDGLYSTKSDVFSFGVLVLEIISGRRNRGFNHPDHHLNLLGHAWKQHIEGRSLELLDPSMEGSFCTHEVLRSIHLALLCVQKYPEDRPGMSSVVLILGSEGELPSPKQPGFFTERDVHAADSSTSSKEPSSGNMLSLTLLEAR